jgi:hypothetical protein
MSVETTSAELQELYRLLTLISEKMSEINTKAGATTIAGATRNIKAATLSTSQLLSIFTRTIFIMRKIGLPDQVTDALGFLQEMISLVWALYIAMLALRSATTPGLTILSTLGVGASLTAFAGSIG